MQDHKRIVVSVPVGILQEVDGISGKEKRQRSELICDAMRYYLEERKRRDLREWLRQGYMEMGRINLQLAEEGLCCDDGLAVTVEASVDKAGGSEK